MGWKSQSKPAEFLVRFGSLIVSGKDSKCSLSHDYSFTFGFGFNFDMENHANAAIAFLIVAKIRFNQLKNLFNAQIVHILYPWCLVGFWLFYIHPRIWCSWHGKSYKVFIVVERGDECRMVQKSGVRNAWYWRKVGGMDKFTLNKKKEKTKRDEVEWIP